MFRSIAESYLSDSDVFWVALADLGVKATVVLLLAAAGARAMRRRSAAARHAAWTIAVGALLAVPMLGWVLPQWQVAVWRDAGPSVGGDAATAGLPATPRAADPEGTPTGAGMPPDESFSDLPEEDAPAAAVSSLRQSHGTAPVVSSADTDSRPTGPVIWVLLTWSAGGIVVLASHLRGLIAIWLLRRQSQRVTDDDWQTLLLRISRRAGLRRAVSLMQSERVKIPMTWGFLRPVVLLPEAARTWPEEQRRAVLLHELSHVRRCDVLTQSAAGLACTLYWWHPLVWWAARRLRIEREEACDDQVLLSGMKPSSYASHLLEVAKSLRGGVSLFSVASAMAQRSQLRARVTAVLEDRSRRPISRTAVGAAVMVAVATLIPLAVIRPTLSAQEAQTPDLSDQPIATEAGRNPDASDSQRVDLYGDPIPKGALTRLGTMRLCQRQGARTIAFSPDGRTLASSGHEDSIRLWDVRTGRLLRRYRGTESDRSRAIAFSPDGKRLVSGGRSGLVRLWDVKSGKEVYKKRAQKEDVYSIAYAPDGRTFATAADGWIRLWDVSTGADLLRLGPGWWASFSPDGKTLAAGGGDIRLWNLETGADPLVIENAGAGQVVFINGGKRFISTGARTEPGTTEFGVGASISVLRVWDAATGKLLDEFEAEEPDRGLCRIALSEDGKILASGHYERLRIWDVQTGKVIRTIDGEPTVQYGQYGPAISPDGKILASLDVKNGIWLWDIATGRRLLDHLESHGGQVTSVSWARDGRRVATAGTDSMVRVWDPVGGRLVQKFRLSTLWARAVLFSADGRTVVAAGEARDPKTRERVGVVKLFSVATGKELRVIDMPGRAMGAALSQDGKLLAVAAETEPFTSAFPGGTIHVWEFGTGAKLAELRGYKHHFPQMTFSPDGKSLFCLSASQTVRHWSLPEGKELGRFTVGERTSFSRAGCFAADAKAVFMTKKSRSEGSSFVELIARELPTGKERFSIKVPSTTASALAVSPGGEILALSLAPDPNRRPVAAPIVLWDAASGRKLLDIEIDDGRAISLAFSPDGKTLVSGMLNGTALVWDVAAAYAKLGH